MVMPMAGTIVSRPLFVPIVLWCKAVGASLSNRRLTGRSLSPIIFLATGTFWLISIPRLSRRI